jgi:hypothetical protein
VNRFHIIDDIPFAESLRFDMENWHHNPLTRTTRAAVSYWYARPGGSDFFPSLDTKRVAPVPVPPYEMPRVAGAIEAEGMRIVDTDRDAAYVAADERFSGGRQLRWRGAQVGDALNLAFVAEPSGDNHVIARLALSARSPRVQLRVNGQKAGDPIDLSHHRTTPADEVDLGTFHLAKGEHRLTLTVVGPGSYSPARERYTVTLDYIRLESRVGSR